MAPTVGDLNHLRPIELSWALKAHLMSGSLPPPISHNGYIYSNPGRNGRKIQCEREKTSCYQQVEEGNYIQYSDKRIVFMSSYAIHEHIYCVSAPKAKVTTSFTLRYTCFTAAFCRYNIYNKSKALIGCVL